MSEGHARSRSRSRAVATVAALGSLAVETSAVARHGYGLGGNVVVRCGRGHLFTTIWIPGASFKALRLGWTRFQRCPVEGHFGLVRPVALADLSEEERGDAAKRRDLRVP